jgi:glyceraldehyde 3-phosphate dehydrogenase
MPLRVAINGFSGIGRLVLRSIIEHERRNIEVVSINDLGPVDINAHLLRYDSIHGRFPGVVDVQGDTIDVGLGPIEVTAIRDPAGLPHKALGVDIALECTVALAQIQVMDGKMARVLAWYDKEWGFSTRVADVALAMAGV